MTLSEFELIQRGYVEKWELGQREEWERIRWQTFILLQPSIEANSLKYPKDLISFPWETTQKLTLKEAIKNNLFDKV